MEVERCAGSIGGPMGAGKAVGAGHVGLLEPVGWAEPPGGDLAQQPRKARLASSQVLPNLGL